MNVRRRLEVRGGETRRGGGEREGEREGGREGRLGSRAEAKQMLKLQWA